MQRKAPFMILAAALMFASVAPLVRLLEGRVSGPEIAGLRGLIGGLTLIPVWIGVCHGESSGYVVRRTALHAAVFVALSSFLSLIALSMQAAATSATLLYGAPAYAVLLNPLYGKRTTKDEAWVAVAAFLALIVMSMQRGGFTLPGVAVGLASGFALLHVGYKFHAMDRSSDKVLALALGSALQAIVLPFGSTSIGSISNIDWALIAAIGIFTSALPNLFLGLAIQRGESLIHQTLLLSFEPIFQVSLAYLVVGENPGIYGFVGCAMHMTAIAIYQVRRAQQSQMLRANPI